ncbi:DUF6465 family protein [Lachnoclostridium sp. Marseille-P6806]|uniref:DUF6465 family protein n=1 Tax=Lachnoclostridium sp. Marseille-P6806 TaxID=2364793 RepID=UPI001030899F|nr:DUF6465 family protein [Lachnoclostridium sp. Marseille-P6806]
MAEKKTTAKPKATVKQSALKKEDVAAKIDSTVKAAEEKAEEMAKEVKTVKKAAAKTVKAVEKKAAEVKKTASRAVKKSAPKMEMRVQFFGKDYSTEELAAKALEVVGKTAADAKDVKLYVKPEESRVYYVIDGEVGSFEI